MPEELPQVAGQEFAADTFNFCRPSLGAAAPTRCLSELLVKVADLVTSTRELPKLFEELAPVLQAMLNARAESLEPGLEEPAL